MFYLPGRAKTPDAFLSSDFESGTSQARIRYVPRTSWSFVFCLILFTISISSFANGSRVLMMQFSSSLKKTYFFTMPLRVQFSQYATKTQLRMVHVTSNPEQRRAPHNPKPCVAHYFRPTPTHTEGSAISCVYRHGSGPTLGGTTALYLGLQ